jgi:hydrogenase expression/formation protein HypC
LALPGKVKTIHGDTAQVDFSGIEREVSVRLIPKVKTGDYIIVHAGFAIQILDKNAAKETIQLLNTL